MKNITRFLLGLLASLFLTVGFVRAAEICSPANMTRQEDHAQSAPDCALCTECSATQW